MDIHVDFIINKKCFMDLLLIRNPRETYVVNTKNYERHNFIFQNKINNNFNIRHIPIFDR